MFKFFLKPLVLAALIAQCALLFVACHEGDVRVIVQGPRPTTPVIAAAAVPNSDSEIDVTLITPSTGPAPPYTYRLEEAPSAAGPWTTIASGVVFTGSPAKFRRGSLTQLSQRFYRVTALDSASPARNAVSLIHTATTNDITPAAFDYNDLTNQAAAAFVTADTKVVVGISAPVAISVTNCQYVILAPGEPTGPGSAWTSAPGTIASGQQFSIRVLTPSTPDTQIVATVTVGSFTADWSVRTTGSSAIWVENTPSYLPIVPGAACQGANQVGGSGRHLGGSNNAAILFLDDRAIGSVGSFDSATRIGHGTARYCFDFAGPRHVIPLVNGIIDFGGGTDSNARNVVFTNPYMTFHGHAAPGHLVFRAMTLICNGHDTLLWHLGSLQDEFATTTISTARGDCIQILTSPLAQDMMFANCAFMWASDEAMDFFRACQRIGVWQCIVAETLNPPGGDINIFVNAGILFADDATPVSVHRSLFAHLRQRQPLTESANISVLNNLIYNTQSVAIDLRSDSGAPVNANLEHNLHVNGPTNPTLGSMVRFQSGSNPLSPASQVFMGGNEAIGQSYATQRDLLADAQDIPLQVARVASAYPAGYVVTPIGSTLATKRAFAELVMRYVGPRPLSRLSTYQRVINHVMARLNGTGDQGGQMTVPSSVGFPSITNVGPIEPSNPGAFWGGVPLPMNLATRNQVMPSGYTRIEEWSHGVASLFMPAGWNQ